MVAALASVSSLALAQSGERPAGSDAADARNPANYLTRQPPIGAPRICLANELIGANVASPQGEAIGKLEDVVVYPGGEVAYAVVSFGGIMGLGDKLFAVPWSSVSCADLSLELRDKDPNRDHDDIGTTARDRSRERVVLSIPKERLKNAPGFDKDHWPEMANPAWSTDVDTYYAITRDSRKLEGRHATEASAKKTSSVIWRLSDLKGQKVQSPDDSKLGEIRDVAVDTNGRASYVIVSVGGALGLGDRKVAVPWNALTFMRDSEKDKAKVVLQADKERLEQAPQVKPGKDNEPTLRDPAWIEQVYDFYSVPPYWSRTDADSQGVPRENQGGKSDYRDADDKKPPK
jgi:sporulation protein YlmC with PRC-barrel domain